MEHRGSTVARALRVTLLFAILVWTPLQAQERLQMQTLTFSASTWIVRQTLEPEGPMDNYFGGRDLSVMLNPEGSLTLSLAREEGIWHSGEVTMQKRTGYGTYLFKVRTSPSTLDPNIVLGLFTYSSASAYSHREIDIEFSAWGVRNKPVLGQYVIQPYEIPGHIDTFDISGVDGPATYSFVWSEGKVEFASWIGYGPRPQTGSPQLIAAWTYIDPKAVPKPSAQVHMNLYLAHGAVPPSGQGSTSVTIDAFQFIPAK
ncbi:MAG: hypothetical protein WC820_00935 [Spirochaetales bacterium]|jgi:hypothetical protein